MNGQRVNTGVPKIVRVEDGAACNDSRGLGGRVRLRLSERRLYEGGFCRSRQFGWYGTLRLSGGNPIGLQTASEGCRKYYDDEIKQLEFHLVSFCS